MCSAPRGARRHRGVLPARGVVHRLHRRAKVRPAAFLAGPQEDRRQRCRTQTPADGGVFPRPRGHPRSRGAVHREIFEPLLAGLRARGSSSAASLYAGLMIERGVPRVLEFNVRFGTPSAAALPSPEKRSRPPAPAVRAGKITDAKMEIDPRPTVCVVMSSGGYPGSYRRAPDRGIEEAEKEEGVWCSTPGNGDEGESLACEPRGARSPASRRSADTLKEAIARAYRAVGRVHGRAPYLAHRHRRKALRGGG